MKHPLHETSFRSLGTLPYKTPLKKFHFNKLIRYEVYLNDLRVMLTSFIDDMTQILANLRNFTETNYIVQ